MAPKTLSSFFLFPPPSSLQLSPRAPPPFSYRTFVCFSLSLSLSLPQPPTVCSQKLVGCSPPPLLLPGSIIFLGSRPRVTSIHPPPPPPSSFTLEPEAKFSFSRRNRLWEEEQEKKGGIKKGRRRRRIREGFFLFLTMIDRNSKEIPGFLDYYSNGLFPLYRLLKWVERKREIISAVWGGRKGVALKRDTHSIHTPTPTSTTQKNESPDRLIDFLLCIYLQLTFDLPFFCGEKFTKLKFF